MRLFLALAALKTPLMILRWLTQRPPRLPDFGRCGFNRNHRAFDRSPRSMTMTTTREHDGHEIRAR